MAQANTEERLVRGELRLASMSLPLDRAHPEALVRWGEGLPRGFWVREGRWFAHAGAAATLEVVDPEEGPHRFRKVWDEARRLLASSWLDPESEVTPPPNRLFGGFSFRDDHRAEAGWEGFPLAHFVLPEIELVGGEDGGILTLRTLLPAADEPGRSLAEARARLRVVRDELRSSLEQGSGGEPWVPATRSDINRSRWARAVERALAEIDMGEMSKVVLARAQTLVVEGRLDPVDVALNLWRQNLGAHAFLFEPVPGRVLLGAAPETVSTVQDRVFRATAVAGSIARGNTNKERDMLARALLDSEKDRREHRLCVEDMVMRLRDHADHVEAQAEPHVLTLSSIQHLETHIQAELRPGETALTVLESLHPTPAVCGLPRDRALAFLREEESFPRGWYAGPVGWFDGEGNGVFVPALRSAVGGRGEWKLFAGSGIVAGSKASREWDETRIKFQPVLKALAKAGTHRSDDGNGSKGGAGAGNGDELGGARDGASTS